jgi:predicted nuclease of predicted toxin-antitoxin system
LKLLFDENLAPRLARSLDDVFPESRHVRDLGLLGADDEILWGFARDNGFAIVSKDSDFQQRSFLRGHPPKFIWIRLGNRPTAAVESVLRARRGEVATFDADPDAALLILD